MSDMEGEWWEVWGAKNGGRLVEVMSVERERCGRAVCG